MTSTTQSLRVFAFGIVGVGLIMGFLTILALPGFAYAATYAYVNQGGEVMTTIANTPADAIKNAPSIHVHSGVLLLDSAADAAVVGDEVSGT
jgi:hypothetical protein